MEGGGTARRRNTISNIETVIHLVKGKIGTTEPTERLFTMFSPGIGVLTMPIAMSCAGLVGGVLGMIFVALLTIHCMHLLVISAQKLVREKYSRFVLEAVETYNVKGCQVSGLRGHG